MNDDQFYLGLTAGAEGDRPVHVFAELRLERATHGVSWTDVHHEVHSHERLKFAASFTLIAAHRGFRPLEGPSGVPDRLWLSAGQIPPEERVIADTDGRTLSASDVEFIEGAWSRWHLNTLRAGCVHTEGVDFQHPIYEVPDEVLPHKVSGWKLDNVRCPTTGYRWGRDWLTELLPMDVVSRVRELLASA